MIWLFAATLLGLCAGFGGAALREYAEPRVWSWTDVTAATLGVPVLGAIPRSPRRASNGARNGNGRKIRLMPAQAFVSDHLVTRDDPHDPAAEAYRALRTNVIYHGRTTGARAIVITSVNADDGKSTSASNLAVSFAQQGYATLMVDADLRRGALHRLFDVPRSPGFAEVLSGDVAFDDAVRTVSTGKPGATLHLLATGALPADPAELLGSPAMDGLLAQLRERYDMVVLDAPPLNVVTDATVLGLVADSLLLVARVGTTERRALQDATDTLRRLQIQVGGVILNGTSSSREYYGPERTARVDH